MDYKQHTIGLIIRLVLILAVMMCVPLSGRFFEPGQLVFTYLVFATLLIILTIELYFFLNRILKEIITFLDHIKNRDFSLRFNDKEARGSRKNLYRTFNDVLQTYRDIRIEKEVQLRFMEHIIELIEIGIIVLGSDGKVVLSNTAAGNLLGVPELRSWEQMTRKNPGLGSAVESIERSGKFLFETGIHGVPERLAIQVSRTRMLDRAYSLVAIQDIKGVVEQKETGAWIRLLQTLNHEIKNSVTPISSLADTLLLILKTDGGGYKAPEELDGQNLSDIITSVETLQQRSRSLHTFVEEYHKLTRIPVPNPEMISCRKLLEETAALFKPDLDQKKIGISLEIKNRDSQIRADRGLVDQILINLVNNSMDALKECDHPEIVLGCRSSLNGWVLSVSDNGDGIDTKILEDVFIPFFSTKSFGSGIGLSLVRQIMRLHGGDVRISSGRGEGTVVHLTFPEH